MLVTSEQPGGLTEEGWFHDYSCQYKRPNVGGMHVSILHTRVCAVVCCICVWVCVSVSSREPVYVRARVHLHDATRCAALHCGIAFL